MTATISREDQEVADALAYIRDAGGFPPDATQDAILRYCVLSTAEAMKVWLSRLEKERGETLN